MGKIIFTDSRAIKITDDMRKALNSYNEKKQALEDASNELRLLEDLRKEKDSELEGLNIKALDSDKKVAKEASKKIKTIDKEINKIVNDVRKITEKISKLEEQNKVVNVQGVTLKLFNDLNKEAGRGEDEKLPEINNDIIMPEMPMDSSIMPEMSTDVANSFNDVQEAMPAYNDINEEVKSIEDYSLETEPVVDVPVVEPVVLEDVSDSENIVVNNEAQKDQSSDLESELDEVSIIEENKDNMGSDKVINNFLSEDDLDKMWDALNDNSNNDIKEMSEEDTKSEEIVEESKEEKKVAIEKPNIFGDDSKFAKIAHIVVAPSPLVPEDNITELIPYNDYNDYMFKFGQDHYGKEALTPKEISDLANIKNFLDSDTFELERSKQYNNTMKENEELRDRITKLDIDYNNKIDEMSYEHNSNLDELSELIDKANNIISDNRANIRELEEKNKNLNNTVNNQSDEISSLNDKKSELESTIDKLNNDIKELERIKEEQENKIKNYESKFKEVLGIVKEIKTDN